MPYFSAEAPGLLIRNCWFSDTARSRTWSDVVNEHGRADETNVSEAAVNESDIVQLDRAAKRTLRRGKRVVYGAVVKPALIDYDPRADLEDRWSDDSAVDVCQTLNA